MLNTHERGRLPSSPVVKTIQAESIMLDIVALG